MRNLNIKGSVRKTTAFMIRLAMEKTDNPDKEIELLIHKIANEMQAPYHCTTRIHFVDLRTRNEKRTG